MLGLIVFMSAIFGWQVIVGDDGYWSYMLVPADLIKAWDEALAGDFQWREFVPLLSAAFLHGVVLCFRKSCGLRAVFKA